MKQSHVCLSSEVILISFMSYKVILEGWVGLDHDF